MQMFRISIISLATFLMVCSPVFASEYEFITPGEVAVIADVNGQYDGLIAVLQEVVLVDESLNWSGGNTHFISLGNLLDDSGGGGKVISLLMKLENQALSAGGKLHTVLGDNDVDVLLMENKLPEASRHWLQELPVIIKVNDVVYTHGGISDGLVEESITALNEAAKKELMTLASSGGDTPADESVFSKRNPVRYRGTAICHPYSESFNTERFLKKVGARQMVVGHVPTGGQVMSRMDGLVVLLDTGISEGGRPAILIMPVEGERYVHYLGSDAKEPVVAEWNQLSQRISGMTDQEVDNLLTNSPRTSVNEIGTGITNPWRITQLREGIEHSALFKYVDTDPNLQSGKYYNRRKGDVSDRYIYEVAAYKLDRMLDIQLIPVAVVGTVKGKEGILQDWITNAINERDRLEEEVPFDGPCRQLEQYRLRIVFDILIYNEDRNLTNIMWAKENFKMRFIDHTRAFRSSKKRPEQYRQVSIRVSDLLKARLESLTTASLTEELGDYLHPKQIESLLARRDLILDKMESTGSW